MRRYRKQAGSSLGRRAQRGGVAMGMMAQSGRRSAFRGQTGEKAGCTCPCAANFDPMATTNDDSCVYTGGPSPVGAVYDKPFEDLSTTPMGVRPFRKQAGNQQGGCGSPLAINYDPNATCNDGSCVFQEGCTIIGSGYYNQWAVIDNGTCSCGSLYWIEDIPWNVTAACDLASQEMGFDSYADYVASTQTPSNQHALVPSCSTGAGVLTGTKDPRGKQGKKFRGQTGEKAGCTCPCAANYDPMATTNDDSCVYTGGPSPVGAVDGPSLVGAVDGKPFEDLSTTPMGVRPFRKQAGDIPTCPANYVGTPIPQPMEGFGVPILDPQLSGCGRCRCQTPDGPDCPDMYGQWLGGSPFNVEESTCNCDYQSDGCVNPTGGGLLDPSLSKPTFNKLPRLRGKMRNQTGKMSRATQTGSGHKMRCGTPAGGSSNFGYEYPEPTWGFTGCDYLFGTQSECQAKCTSRPSPMGDTMKGVTGRDMCGFYSNPSDAPFTG